MAKLIKKDNYWPMRWEDSSGNIFKWSTIMIIIAIIIIGIMEILIRIYRELFNKKCMENRIVVAHHQSMPMINKIIDQIIAVHKNNKKIFNVSYQKIADSTTTITIIIWTTIIITIDNTIIKRWIKYQHKIMHQPMNKHRIIIIIIIIIIMELVLDQKVKDSILILRISLIIGELGLGLMMLKEAR